MRTLLPAALLLLAPFASARAQQPQGGVAVVELFTSEGCSSCPPAEALLNEIDRAAHDDAQEVYALAFHVDYWNSLGWIDRFSTRAFSERQARYGRALEGGRVYTPQMVVNGETAFVGSDRARARDTIARALRTRPGVPVSARAARDGQRVVVDVALGAVPRGSVVQVALVAHDVTSAVTSGENRGRTLVHRGVVRALATRPAVGGRVGAELALPRDVDVTRLEVVAFVQDEASLRVLGAGRARVAP